MKSMTLAEAVVYAKNRRICLYLPTTEMLKKVLKALDNTNVHWASGHKPSKWISDTWELYYGYLCLYDTYLTQGRGIDGEEIHLLDIDAPASPVEKKGNSSYCSCGGPTEHIKYTTFEYDLCTSCKLEKL
jgi:hypothetical protein